jgi:hypothetical protein
MTYVGINHRPIRLKFCHAFIWCPGWEYVSCFPTGVPPPPPRDKIIQVRSADQRSNAQLKLLPLRKLHSPEILTAQPTEFSTHYRSNCAVKNEGKTVRVCGPLLFLSRARAGPIVEKT